MIIHKISKLSLQQIPPQSNVHPHLPRFLLFPIFLWDGLFFALAVEIIQYNSILLKGCFKILTKTAHTSTCWTQSVQTA